MSADFDTRLSGLAAQILRDAVGDLELRAASQLSLRPVGWSMTASFPAITGTLPVLTGSFPALTGSFPAQTSSFPALTGSFAALGSQAAAGVSLKELFGLGAKLAPVRLQPLAQLAEQARSAPLMGKLEALATWLDRGRLVGPKDELSDADATAAAGWAGVSSDYLPYLWEYALTAGWFELDDEPGSDRTWAVPGGSARRWAARDDMGALQVWAVVFAAVLSRALEVSAVWDPEAARRLNFDGQGVVVAMTLFLARRAGLHQADVGDLVMDGAVGGRPSSRTRRAWDGWVRKHGDPGRLLVSELIALHAVGAPERNGGVVGLSPLAVWALREQVMRDGVMVPVLSTRITEMSAARLVSLADGIEEKEFAADVAAWVAGRGSEPAANELLAFAGVSPARPRLVAINLARGIGVAAHRAWRDAMQRPELRGYARMALSLMAADLPRSTLPLATEPTQDDLARVADDLLELGLGESVTEPWDVASVFREAVPEGAELWIIDLMARTSLPQVARVLTVLGRRHLDPAIARAARKAARRVRRARRRAR